MKYNSHIKISLAGILYLPDKFKKCNGNCRIKHRISLNLSQSQLAFEANSTREFINKVEAAKLNISLTKLCQIAEVLQIQVTKLFVV